MQSGSDSGFTSATKGQDQMKSMGQRRMAIGAELSEGGVHFRVWAPTASRVAVAISSEGMPQTVELKQDAEGYYSGLMERVGAGARYGFQIDGDRTLRPD